jgi:hypothetical protein
VGGGSQRHFNTEGSKTGGGKVVKLTRRPRSTPKTHFLVKVKERKAIPVTGRGDLEGFEILRIPYCIDNRLTDGSAYQIPSITVIFVILVFEV